MSVVRSAATDWKPLGDYLDAVPSARHDAASEGAQPVRIVDLRG